MEKSFLSGLADKWPSAIVSRGEVQRFTGGLINGRTLANLDSQGEGPANRFRVGRKVAYPVADFLDWLRQRIQAI